MTKKMTTEETAAKNMAKWWGKSSVAPQQANKILQTITFNLGSFDDENRTFKAIGSTPCVDRQGDIIQQDGWELENFKANPVIPWAHDYYQPPVARAIEVGVSDGVLQFVCQFPQEGLYPFADTIWNLYRNQFMFAFSVGFIPEEPEDGWSWEGNTFGKCELLEISAVVVPANPQALALAAKSGVINTSQTKQLISKLQGTVTNLEDILKAQEIDEKATKAVEDASTAQDAAEIVRSLLVEAGLLKGDAEKDLTDINAKQENEDMQKIKDVSESGSGAALTPEQHAGTKAITDTLKAVSEALALHADALNAHSETMKQHAELVAEKAETLTKQAEKLSKLAPSDDDAAEEKTVTDSVVKDVTAAEGEEISSTTDDDTTDTTEEVADGEVKSEEETTDVTETTEEAAPEEEAAAEVTEETEVAPTDGADHEEPEEVAEVAEVVEKSADADDLYDPENLSDDQIQKILAALNDRVKQ